MTNFLQKGKTNSTWIDKDMHGLDIDLVVHHLTVDPKIKPVKQKLRKMHTKVAFLVKEKLQKLLEAKFIHPIDYPKWSPILFLKGKHLGAFVFVQIFEI